MLAIQIVFIPPQNPPNRTALRAERGWRDEFFFAAEDGRDPFVEGKVSRGDLEGDAALFTSYRALVRRIVHIWASWKMMSSVKAKKYKQHAMH